MVSSPPLPSSFIYCQVPYPPLIWWVHAIRTLFVPPPLNRCLLFLAMKHTRSPNTTPKRKSPRCKKCPNRPFLSHCQHTKKGRLYLRSHEVRFFSIAPITGLTLLCQYRHSLISRRPKPRPLLLFRVPLFQPPITPL